MRRRVDFYALFACSSILLLAIVISRWLAYLGEPSSAWLWNLIGAAA